MLTTHYISGMMIPDDKPETHSRKPMYMTIPIHLLAWDTKHFGHRIVRVTVHTLTVSLAQEIDKWCINNDIECVYFLCAGDDSDAVRVAEDFGYRLQDIRVTFAHKLNDFTRLATLPLDIRLDTATETDESDLLQIADGIYQHSRFYSDVHFETPKVDAMYRIWMRRSLSGDLADTIFVARVEGIVQGFVTAQLNTDTGVGELPLVGIAPALRGKGVGIHIILQALHHLKQQSATSVEVVTQGRNIAAQRLYQKAGFRTANVQLWYHKWYR